MKVIILYEQKQYSCEMKQDFMTSDIISNMRKIIGGKENQKYILCDTNGKKIEDNHFFFYDSKNEMTLYLMKMPTFNAEEPIYNDNIKDDIISVIDKGLSTFDLYQKFPINHGNPEKKREPNFEMIANIFGSFNDLPDLEKETTRK